MPSKRNKKLIKQYGGEVVPYVDLPEPAQLAIAHYMAVNGEAWKLPEDWAVWPDMSTGPSRARIVKELKKYLDYFIDKYGAKKFGYVLLPMKAVTDSVMAADQDIAGEYDSFPKHSADDPWPVILSNFEDETLQDGWHRLHRYYQLGLKEIPAVYFHDSLTRLAIGVLVAKRV